MINEPYFSHELVSLMEAFSILLSQVHSGGCFFNLDSTHLKKTPPSISLFEVFL